MKSSVDAAAKPFQVKIFSCSHFLFPFKSNSPNNIFSMFFTATAVYMVGCWRAEQRRDIEGLFICLHFQYTYPRFIWNIKKMCIISINRYKSSYLLNINLYRHHSHKNIRFSSKVISSLSLSMLLLLLLLILLLLFFSTLYESRMMGGKMWILCADRKMIYLLIWRINAAKTDLRFNGCSQQQHKYIYFYIKFLLLPSCIYFVAC